MCSSTPLRRKIKWLPRDRSSNPRCRSRLRRSSKSTLASDTPLRMRLARSSYRPTAEIVALRVEPCRGELFLLGQSRLHEPEIGEREASEDWGQLCVWGSIECQA